MRELTVTANLPRFSHTLTSGVQLLAKGLLNKGAVVRRETEPVKDSKGMVLALF